MYTRIKELKSRIKSLTGEKNEIIQTLADFIIGNKKGRDEDPKPVRETIFSEKDPPYQPTKSVVATPAKEKEKTPGRLPGVGWLGGSIFPLPKKET